MAAKPETKEEPEQMPMPMPMPMKQEEEEEEEEEEPTVKYSGWKAMPYVIGNETFEKVGTLGTSMNLLVYLKTVFHMQSVKATTLLQIFHGTQNLAPVFGAFLSDAYFGRYWTLAFASVASLFGMLIITLTAAMPSLHPPHCDMAGQAQQCAGPTTGHLAVLLSAFAFLVVGAGGIRPCNLTFGADQFDPHTDSGRRGIASFFNWYYFTFTSAMMVSATVIIYIQTDISWTLGFAIPTALMLLSCAFFFLGTRLYVRVKPEGSPFTSFAQVLLAAIKKRRLDHPHHPQQSLYNLQRKYSINSKLPHTQQLRFLDKAAIKTPEDETKPDGSAANPWGLCSLQQVEEVKCLVRIMPIWSAGILHAFTIAANSSYGVFQALQSDRHLGKSGFQIPAGSFSLFAMLALTIWIPIYDRIIVPRLQKITGREGGITLLQRMGVGQILSIVAMVVAALVEEKRRGSADSSRPNAVSAMSSLWMVPQLVILGLAEAFNSIGQIEFYYRQFPENMRSVAGSLLFLSTAVAGYLTSTVITVVHQTTGGDGRGDWLDEDLNKGKLDYFYYLTAVIGMFNFVYFITCAKWYKYKRSETEAEISLEETKINGSLV